MEPPDEHSRSRSSRVRLEPPEESGIKIEPSGELDDKSYSHSTHQSQIRPLPSGDTQSMTSTHSQSGHSKSAHSKSVHSKSGHSKSGHSRPSRSTLDGSRIRRKRGTSKEPATSRTRGTRYSALTGRSGGKTLSSDYEGARAADAEPTTHSSSRSTRSHGSAKVVGDEYYKAMEEKLKHEEIMSRKHQPGMSSNHAMGQLPWSEDDNDSLRDQVAFWKNCLVEDDERVPRDDVRELLKTLYTVLRQESILRSDRALAEVSKRLENLQRLDLQHLIELMNNHQQSGEVMEGKDVLLLTGAAGSGKTTTLHFLAGTKFVETEVDGFMHLKPAQVKDARLNDFKTACGREAITRGLQATSVTFKDTEEMDKSVVVCDTPGFGIMATPEEELAYHYGMSAALDMAKRVKPVVVLNQELMGSCFANLPETLDMMTQELSLKTPRDLKALDYVFTHYKERHRRRLCQQFSSLKQNKPPKPEGGGRDSLFDDFLNDLIAKTTPKANLAIPLDDDRHDLLRALWQETFVEEPRDYYHRKPAPESALKKLQIQLQITLEELRMALSREVYSVALNRMVILDKLSVWFPQAKQAALMAKEAASRQVKMIWNWMAKEIENANYERALFRMEQMSDFGLIFPDAHECFKHGHDLIWESLVAPMEDKDFDLTMERLKQLHALSRQYTEASVCVKRGLRLVRKKIEFVIENGGFNEALSVLFPLSSLEEDDAPEASECARTILTSLKELMECTLFKRDFSTALQLIRKLNTLQAIYPQAEVIASKGLSLCRNMLEAAVANGDYDSALFLVQHMQRLKIEIPQAEEIANFGMGIFSDTIEVLIQHKDYSKAIEIMKKVGMEVSETEALASKGVDLFGKKAKPLLHKEQEKSNVIKTTPVEEVNKKGIDGLSDEVENLIQNEKDYGKALMIMKEVNSEVGSDECAKLGIGLFGEEVENLIQNEKEYDKALMIMKEINSEVGSDECTKRGIGVFCDEVESLIQNGKDYMQAISLLHRVNDEVPGSEACTLRTLDAVANEVRSLVDSKEYNSAISLMKQVESDVPSSNSCVLHGLNIFASEIELLIGSKEYGKAVSLMKRLAADISGTGDYIRTSLTMLKGGIRAAITAGDFQTALDAIYEVNGLAKILPQAEGCLEYAFSALEEHILISIDRQEYGCAIQLMELLSAGADKLPSALECTRVGIQVLKRNVVQAIQKKKYTPALDMIQQLSDRGQVIPEVGECSRRGLELLKTTAEQAITEKDYNTAIEIITNLSELSQSLPEAKECTLSALHAILDHITKLRHAVETTVEEVSQIRDLKVFVAMLLKLKSQIEKVMQSEPLRKLSVQIHYKKTFRSKEEESGDCKILFVPQLYTSHAFCSDNVELLAENVREKLPEFDVNDACMEHLIRNRKGILSVMIRLKAAHRILQQCPGGEKASAVYASTFQQFHALVDAVLAIAEESFRPPVDLRLFELEAWFLSVLINGFIKDKIDVDSPERKQMEELDLRRQTLMLQFEVQITDALEVLSDPGFGEIRKLDPVGTAVENDEQGKEVANVEGNASTEQETAEIKVPLLTAEEHLPITSEIIDKLDLSTYEAPRKAVMNLVQRPELVKMVLKRYTLEGIDASVKEFDRTLLQFIGQLIRYGEQEYNAVLVFARSGAHLPDILDKVVDLKAKVDKIEAHMGVARSWGSELLTDTQVHQQKLLILKKRIELASEKLETTIKTEREIGFGAFMTNITSPFLCSGKWYEDVPTSFL